MPRREIFMNENSKLEEARYFYQVMQESLNRRKPFVYNLSAFLSAARSVLQYTLKEARTKAGGRQWYETQMANHRTLVFFKDKRDVNIHSAPVNPKQDVAIALTETIHVSEALAIRIMDAEGHVVGESSTQGPAPPPPAPEIPPVISTKYTFPDWVGNEDVPALSKLYLQELEAIVNNGIAKGFLTP